MYFAILGKHPEISKAELELIQPKYISFPKKGITIVDTIYPERLRTLGGIIKSGRVVKEKELPTLLAGTKIIGIANEANGKHLKRTAGIRRYKIVDLFHTDKEIKTKGKELINLDNGLYGIVDHYQNIELYETIDFGKPARSMQMGMMPAKLTHILINIGLSISNVGVPTVIYDPFVGSGTTGFLANFMGYDFIGSDIKTDYAKKNLTRRKTTKFATNHQFTLFTHDIKQVLTNKIKPKNILIVTEGWLGPIVKKTTSDQDIQKFQEQVVELYKSFLERIKELGTIAVFTIPRYIGQENGIEQVLTKYANQIGLNIQSIPELYSRAEQYIARKVLIVT